jgi:hypothetical protein
MRNGETFPVNKCSAAGVSERRKILATRKSNADSNGEASINSGKRLGKSSNSEGRQERTDPRSEGKVPDTAYSKTLMFRRCGRIILNAVRRKQEKEKSIRI